MPSFSALRGSKRRCWTSLWQVPTASRCESPLPATTHSGLGARTGLRRRSVRGWYAELQPSLLGSAEALPGFFLQARLGARYALFQEDLGLDAFRARSVLDIHARSYAPCSHRLARPGLCRMCLLRAPWICTWRRRCAVRRFSWRTRICSAARPFWTATCWSRRIHCRHSTCVLGFTGRYETEDQPSFAPTAVKGWMPYGPCQTPTNARSFAISVPGGCATSVSFRACSRRHGGASGRRQAKCSPRPRLKKR